MLNWFMRKDDLKSERGNKPDYSKIESDKKAIELFMKGEFTKVHLIPLEFIDKDITINILFVLEIAKTLKQDLTI